MKATAVLAKAGLAGLSLRALLLSPKPQFPQCTRSGIGQPGPIFLYPQVGLPVRGGKRSRQQAGSEPSGRSRRLWVPGLLSPATPETRGLQAANSAASRCRMTRPGTPRSCTWRETPERATACPRARQRRAGGLREFPKTRLQSLGGNSTLEQHWMSIPAWV